MSEASGFAMASGQTTSLREARPYLDDAQWDLLEKMDAINGRAHTEALLLQGPDEVAAHIARFQLYEAALERHVMDVVTARVAAAQAAVPTSAPPEGPKPVRVAVFQHSGEEDENLIFWQRENELAMAAARIRDERQKITFAISNMKGRAKTWALTCETSQPGFFQSWATLVAATKAVFQPPNVAHRQRAAFLASSQGERELYVYVQELRQLRASMAANAIAEDVMVTVFMDNMKAGPAKAAVFREEPTTLYDPFAIALREDYVQRLARGQPVQQVPGSLPPAAAGQAPAEAMDVSLLDLSQVDLATVDLAAIDVNALHIKCFTCSKMGHFQRDCPCNRGSRPSFSRASRQWPWTSCGKPPILNLRVSEKRQFPVDAGRSTGTDPRGSLPTTGSKSTIGRRRRRRELRVRFASPLISKAAPALNVIDAVTGATVDTSTVNLAPLPEFSELTSLEELSMDDFAQELKAGEIPEVVILRSERELAELNTSSVIDESVMIEFRQKFDARRGSTILKNPKDRYYPLVKRFADTCLSKDPPTGLPPDRGIRHEIKLKPGSSYATVRQWALPAEQSDFIDEFFAKKLKDGLVREMFLLSCSG